MNYTLKQATLNKLAQTRLAVNYILRNRYMNKLAEGGLPLVKDPLSDQYNPFKQPNKTVISPWTNEDFLKNQKQIGFAHNYGKNTLGGLMDSATNTMITPDEKKRLRLWKQMERQFPSMWYPAPTEYTTPDEYIRQRFRRR